MKKKEGIGKGGEGASQEKKGGREEEMHWTAVAQKR